MDNGVSKASPMSIGDQLNRMVGAANTDKDLYKKPNEMGKESFLKLFMEQLKYQDPLNPVKNEQFSQQMAMFSQLEQSVNMNKNLEKLLGQQNNMQIAALQLVGKNVLADRGALYHDKVKGITPFAFKLPQDANEVKVDVLDVNGETVKTYNLGARNQGEVQWKWDGSTDAGPPAESGRYSYRVSGTSGDGSPLSISTKLEGRVSGVTTSNGVVFLLVGDQRIALNEVETIKEGSGAASENSSSDKNPAGTNPESKIVGEGISAANAKTLAQLGALQNVGDGGSDRDRKVAISERLEQNLADTSDLEKKIPLYYR